MHLCVLHGSRETQSLFRSTVLNESVFINETETVHCAVRNESLHLIEVVG